MSEPTSPSSRTAPTPAPPAPATATPAAATLAESGQRAGHYAWIEMRLFEVLGGWVATVPEVAVKAALAAQAHRHAWHAEMWHGHLPRVGDEDAAAVAARLVVPPTDASVALVDALAGPAAPTSTAERLAGLYRVVLPRLVTAYDRHLATTSPLTDGPVARTLRLVLNDDVDDWRAGEALLQSLPLTADDVDRAAAHQARLEKLVLSAGGIAGPSTMASG